MERLRGHEALKQYSFRDVTVDQGTAVQILAARSRIVVATNVDHFLGSSSDRPSPATEVRKLKELRSNPDSFFSPGGLSTTESDLGNIYDKLGGMTFQQTLNFVVNSTSNLIWQPKPNPTRDPGIEVMGYMLDLLRIIDPKVASFDDGVQVLIESMRSDQITLNPFLLGAMVDDTIERRETEKVGLDFLTDVEGAEKFRESFRRFGSPNEKTEFEAGIEISPNEAHIRGRGSSLN